MLEELYEWYIYAVGDDADGEAAQSGRHSFARLLETVASSGAPGSSSLPRTESGMIRGHGGSMYSPEYFRDNFHEVFYGNAPGGKVRLGFEMLNFGLDVANVLMIWNPAVASYIRAAKRGTFVLQSSLEESEGGMS